MSAVDVCGEQRVDLAVARPQVGEIDRLAGAVAAQGLVLDVDADAAGQRVGDDQGGRGDEGFLDARVDAAVEVAVAGKDGGDRQLALDNLGVDFRRQRAGHAVAGGAREADEAEALRGEWFEQAGGFEVAGHSA